MGNPESDCLTRVCPGHKLGLNQKCRNCSEDYDTNHFPNNYNCVIYQNFLDKYEKVKKWVSERGVKLGDETLEVLANEIFLANIINPRISVDKILRDMGHMKELRDIPCTKKTQHIDDGCYSPQSL
jgi:hypothetical protein